MYSASAFSMSPLNPITSRTVKLVAGTDKVSIRVRSWQAVHSAQSLFATTSRPPQRGQGCGSGRFQEVKSQAG